MNAQSFGHVFGMLFKRVEQRLTFIPPKLRRVIWVGLAIVGLPIFLVAFLFLRAWLYRSEPEVSHLSLSNSHCNLMLDDKVYNKDIWEVDSYSDFSGEDEALVNDLCPSRGDIYNPYYYDDKEDGKINTWGE
ncbi:hypothetical protein FXN58_11100 [Aggregatibacter actinomycetemcomitans]|uniref:hypothetical protein n=1 Tax=Aggregatibacter actinomycetemcomitans TaxID=714 RepID=UPI0011DDB87B|nr:hypothetical protein [Aggregatibacter actinomycetemcomitans]QEH46010.1 hypothetical protein FXN58_11100 [Aggregatibacter actinomycetemcomitans]